MRRVFGLLMCIFMASALNLLAQNDDMSQIKKYCQDMNDKFGKALMSGDYNTIASMYTDDATSLPSYAPMWVGKDQILEGNKKELETYKYNSFSAKTVNVFGTGDIIYEIGTYQLNFTPANMTASMDDHGKYINIWQKQSDGSWKLKADTWNSDINPMMDTQKAGAKPKSDDYDGK
jgi:uncharacterized protein (TIGR02246 family)